MRFNPSENKPAEEYPLLLFDVVTGKAIYNVHPDQEIDLAIASINIALLQARGIQFSCFMSDKHIATKKLLTDLGFSEGDFGYILGFPMGLVGKERSFVTVRQGAIARIRDYLADASKELLMDCLIFPGNSGGPVVTKPEFIGITGTKTVGSAYLIGVVSGYIPYNDVAISLQTQRPRVVFEDNSGLASVVPIQYLVDLIETLRTSTKTEGLQVKQGLEAKDKTG